MTMYLGDIAASAVIDFMWSSNNANGASITRATNGTLSVYKGNSTTQSTAGVTDTEDFDSLTGIHHCRISTSADGAFYAAGNDFTVVLNGATIDGQTVNAVLAHFSIQNRYIGANVVQWNGAAVATPHAAGYPVVTIKDGAGTGELDTNGGAVNAQVTGMNANVLNASALAADAVTEIQSGLALATAVATLATYVDTEVAAILTAVNAIKAKTDNLPPDPADDSDIDMQLAAIANYLDTEIAAILAKVNNLPASPAAVGSAMALTADAVNSTSVAASAVAKIQAGLSTLTAAQVNAEVVDALTVDTYAELGAVPGATSSLKDKIGWLFILARNKHVTTATQDRLRNDGDSADVGAAGLLDDGSAFMRGKYS